MKYLKLFEGIFSDRYKDENDGDDPKYDYNIRGQEGYGDDDDDDDDDDDNEDESKYVYKPHSGWIRDKKFPDLKNLKVGDIFLCKRTYKGNRFVKGEEYELLDNNDVMTMRYFRDDKPVRFRMSIDSFIKYFEIPEEEKKVTDKEEIDPFGEDEWDDIEEPKFIFIIALGRDYDKVGYVVAEDVERAKEKARYSGMVNRDMHRFIRADKLKDVRRERVRKMTTLNKAQQMLDYLDQAIEDIKEKE